MTKYQTLQELFVFQGHQLYVDANVCFDFVEYLTREFVTYSGWYVDDLEFISLSEPIRAERPDRRMRFNWMGSNRERIRDVTCMLEDGYWYLGLRLRLRPHVSVPFRHQDAWFVIPLIVKRQSHNDESCVVKLHHDDRSYNADQLEALFDLLLGRIETILRRGVQPWLDSPILGDSYKLFGFVLDRDWGKALPADDEAAAERTPVAIAAITPAADSDTELANDSDTPAVATLNGREPLNGLVSNGTIPQPSPELTSELTRPEPPPAVSAEDDPQVAIAEIPPEAQTHIEPPDVDPPDEPPSPRKSTRKRKS